MVVQVQFSRRGDGVIDVDLGEHWRWFTETLLDAVTTRAPRGSDGVNPSTYWIDRTLTALRDAKDGDRIASGNAWNLVLEREEVLAHSQYGEEVATDQRLSLGDFVGLLEAWRAEVARDRDVGE